MPYRLKSAYIKSLGDRKFTYNEINFIFKMYLKLVMV